MSELRVFTFMPDWGLPTTGPFALKLLAWLGLNDIPYEQVIENNPAKGPLGKSPWIEHDGRRIGDSDTIIRYLAARFDRPLEAEPASADLAAAHAFKAAFEERFHQILEWELFIHPEGATYIADTIRQQTPPLVGALVWASMRRHFRRQLHARGIARHDPDTIAALGRAEIDALATFLSQRAFLAGDRPVLADLAVFGQVAPLVHWPMKTPVALHAREAKPVVDWCERIETRALRGNRGTPAACPHPSRASPSPEFGLGRL